MKTVFTKTPDMIEQYSVEFLERVGELYFTAATPTLIIQPVGPLLRRVEAMVSALAICAGENRNLIVIWSADSECKTEFADVFDLRVPVWPYLRSDILISRYFSTLDYSKGAQEPWKANETSKSVFVKLRGPLQHPYFGLDCIEWGRLQFSPAVMRLVRSIPIDTAVALHIRTNMSRFQELIERTRAALRSGWFSSVYLSTPRLEAFERVERTLSGVKVHWLRVGYENSWAAPFLMANIVLLSEARLMIVDGEDDFVKLAALRAQSVSFLPRERGK
jgi:hypothetical protein